MGWINEIKNAKISRDTATLSIKALTITMLIIVVVIVVVVVMDW